MNNLKNIKSLDLSQRLHLMEEIWSSFKYEQDYITSPHWHKDILDKRKKEYKSGNLKTKTLDEIKSFFNK